MAVRSCRVTCRDAQGVEHSVEVTAQTLYEAVAQAWQIFGENDWNKLKVNNFDDLIKIINSDNQNSDSQTLSAFDILKGQKSFQNNKGQDSENPERFNSIINFSLQNHKI